MCCCLVAELELEFWAFGMAGSEMGITFLSTEPETQSINEQILMVATKIGFIIEEESTKLSA